MRGRSGFTLIEVTVSVAILLIVIGAIYATFAAGSRSTSITEEEADIQQTARVLLSQMTTELASAYQRGSESCLVGENTEGPENAPQYDKVSFLTLSHKVGKDVPAGDLCRVTYSIERTEDGEPKGLFYLEDPYPDLSIQKVEETPEELSEMVQEMDVSYLDPDTDEWVPEWQDKTALPTAVRIELTLCAERKNAKPVMVASTVNLPKIESEEAASNGE